MGLLDKAQGKKQKTEKKDIDKIEEKEIQTTSDTGLLQKALQKKQKPEQKESKQSGLLQKAIQKKEKTEEKKEKKSGLLQKALQKKEKTIEKNEIPPKKSGLLEKAQQTRSKPKSESEIDKQSKKKNLENILDDKNKDIIEERGDFGWKGLGCRRIVYENILNEYFYEISEPVLNDFESDKKNELSRLFKMLADVNISNINQEEKEKYLEETLEQIIIDNNVKFTEPIKEDTEKKFSFKNLLKKEKQSTENINENNDNEIKENTKNIENNEKTNNNNEIEDNTKNIENIENKNNIIVENEKNIEINEMEKGLSFKDKLYSILKLGKNKSNNQIEKRKEKLTEAEKQSKEKIFYHIFRDFLGYGKIDIIMKDDGIEDISCDGHHVPVFIYHKKYNEITTNVMFENESELNSFVVRLAQICGKQISIYSPIVDGKLPDGSRLQTTLARTVTKGSTFTIRKFKENPLTPIDMIDFKSISIDMAAYFWLAIERGASILFCGGTASGKTTALNALSLFIPPQHKIITIEDTREVNLPHKNWIAGTTRQGFSSSDSNKTGKDIDMFDLIRAALRQRPKVVIVGEVRGKEAYSLFQAMATGHTSYATVHASDIHTLIQRLENPPISLPRALLTSLDILVFQNAIDMSGKTVRRMTSVTEIVKLDPDTNQLIFMEPFRWISKTDDRFEIREGSKIMSSIRQQSDWSEKQLEQELENRKMILSWMQKKEMKSYIDVGKIVSDYCKYPEKLLKKAREEMKK